MHILLIISITANIACAIKLMGNSREMIRLFHWYRSTSDLLNIAEACIRNLPDKIYDKDGNPYHKFYYGQMGEINYVSDSNPEEVFLDPESIGFD